MNKELIINYMSKENFTKTDMAKKCDISDGALNKILKGEKVQIKVLHKIANTINISILELI